MDSPGIGSGDYGHGFLNDSPPSNLWSQAAEVEPSFPVQLWEQDVCGNLEGPGNQCNQVTLTSGATSSLITSHTAVEPEQWFQPFGQELFMEQEGPINQRNQDAFRATPSVITTHVVAMPEERFEKLVFVEPKGSSKQGSQVASRTTTLYIPNQAAVVTEQPLGQSLSTSTLDRQNDEEDKKRIKQLRKQKKDGQISEEEERTLEALLRKRKQMSDNKYRQKTSAILKEYPKLKEENKKKDEIIQQKDRHIERVETVKKEMQLQIEEDAKRKLSMKSKIKELEEQVERFQKQAKSAETGYVWAYVRAQDFSSELAELDSHHIDEQTNVTPPHVRESLQAHCMELAEIQNHKNDELGQQNGTGRKRRMPSTREECMADEEYNSKPNFLRRLFMGGLKSLKNNFFKSD